MAIVRTTTDSADRLDRTITRAVASVEHTLRMVTAILAIILVVRAILEALQDRVPSTRTRTAATALQELVHPHRHQEDAEAHRGTVMTQTAEDSPKQEEEKRQ